MKKSNQITLEKTLNSFDVLIIAFGAMIGWGWVISSGEWIKQAGVIGTVLGFMIGGLMILFVGLVYAELTSLYPNGGCMKFSKEAFGSVPSFICTWSMILGYIGVVCFESCSLPTILAYIFPDFLQGYLYTMNGFDIYFTWLITAIILAIFITYINIRGIKTAAYFQNILTGIIAIVGIILIVSSSLKGDILYLQDQMFVSDDFFTNTKSIFSIALVAPFFLFGFDVIPQAASEINVDSKKIGKILILSIFLAISFYAFVVLSIGYAMENSQVMQSLNTTGLVAADAMKLLFQSKNMANVLILGGICGIVTSWNSFLIGGSRALFILSKSRMLPSFFSVISTKFNTPIHALYFIGLLSIIAPFFGKEMLNWIANTSSFACCFSYFIVALSFYKIRKKYPDLKRPYKIKYWKTIGILAILSSGLITFTFLNPLTGTMLNQNEFIILFLWFAIGMFFLIFGKLKYKNKFGTID